MYAPFMHLEVRNPPLIEASEADFIAILNKLSSVNLCSNTVGQALVYLMVKPPAPGTPSHERFAAERDSILRDLKEKASIIREAFKHMDGVECFGRVGALYLFPRLGRLPAGSSDFDYCMKLLTDTGLCTVNGAGFGQKPGSHHLRIAFLPSKEDLEGILPKWIDFHNAYVSR